MTLDQAVKFTPRFKGSTVSLSEQKVRVFDKFALRTGRAKIYIGDQQVAEILYTSGWGQSMVICPLARHAYRDDAGR